MRYFCFVDKGSNINAYEKRLKKSFPTAKLVKYEIDFSNAPWMEKRETRNGKNVAKYYLDRQWVKDKAKFVWKRWGYEVDRVHFFVSEENWKESIGTTLYGTNYGGVYSHYDVCATRLRKNYQNTAEHEDKHADKDFIKRHRNIDLSAIFNVQDFDDDVVHGKAKGYKEYHYQSVNEKLKPYLLSAVKERRNLVSTQNKGLKPQVTQLQKCALILGREVAQRMKKKITAIES